MSLHPRVVCRSVLLITGTGNWLVVAIMLYWTVPDCLAGAGFRKAFPERWGVATGEFVRAHGLEGVVAKRADSVYQQGLRTGLWSKHRVNQRSEFVIGEYVPSHRGVDSIVVGFRRGKDLHYAARVRAGSFRSPGGRYMRLTVVGCANRGAAQWHGTRCLFEVGLAAKSRSSPLPPLRANSPLSPGDTSGRIRRH
jgi:hypothetical protein